MPDSKDDAKWKFQILYDLISTAVEQQEREYDQIRNDRNNFEKFIIRTRNEFLSGIGFFISLILALVALEIWPKYYVIYVIITAVIAIAIYTFFNEIMYSRIKKYSKFGKVYVEIIFDELIVLQGRIAGIAILETISNEQVIALTEFLSLLTFAQSYTLKTAGHKLLKTTKADQEQYRTYYEIAKSSIENYKKSDLPYIISRIEKFIADFEENEKKKQLNPFSTFFKAIFCNVDHIKFIKKRKNQ